MRKTRRSLCAYYNFIGFRIRLHTPDPSLARIIHEPVPCFRANREKNVLRPDISILISEAPKGFKPPRKLQSGGSLNGFFRISYCSGDAKVIYTIDNKSFLVSLPGGRDFEILIDAPRSRRTYVFGVLFFIAIVVSLKARGYFALHSALFSCQGAGVLFAGDSGSGKTTLATNIADKYFRYICDDGCLLYRQDKKRVKVVGLPKNVLVPDKRGHFRDPYVFKPDHAGSGVLPLLTEVPAVSRVPRYIIFLKIVRSGATRIRPMAKNLAMNNLIKLSFLMSSEEKEVMIKHLPLLRDLAGQCKCFYLSAAKDAKDHPEKLKVILRRLIR